jgi:hypothetical protein
VAVRCGVGTVDAAFLTVCPGHDPVRSRASVQSGIEHITGLGVHVAGISLFVAKRRLTIAVVGAVVPNLGGPVPIVTGQGEVVIGGGPRPGKVVSGFSVDNVIGHLPILPVTVSITKGLTWIVPVAHCL